MRPTVIDRVAWSVGLSVGRSVTLARPAKTAEAIETPVGLRTLMGPSKHVLDGAQILHAKGQLLGESACPGMPDVTLPVQKRLNRSICRFGFGLRWADGNISSVVPATWRQCALMEWHIGATWRIQLNRPSAAAMRLYVKLL